MADNLVEIMEFDGIELMAHVNNEHGRVLATADVAKGYGVSEGTIRRHLQNHADEFVEGKHFSSVQIMNAREHSNLQTQKTFWSPRGVVRLGMFIRSEQAKNFRNWAEDVLLNRMNNIADNSISEKRLNSVAASMEKISRISKNLRLSKAEGVALLDLFAVNELGYSIMPAIQQLADIKKPDEFIKAIESHDASFFSYVTDKTDIEELSKSFIRGRIDQKLLIKLYQDYHKTDASSKAVMSALRQSGREWLNTAVCSNGAKVFMI